MMSDKTQEGGREGEGMKKKKGTKTAEGHGEKKRGDKERKEGKSERIDRLATD